MNDGWHTQMSRWKGFLSDQAASLLTAWFGERMRGDAHRECRYETGIKRARSPRVCAAGEWTSGLEGHSMLSGLGTTLNTQALGLVWKDAFAKGNGLLGVMLLFTLPVNTGTKRSRRAL